MNRPLSDDELARRLAALPREIEPPRDLWEHIAPRLAGRAANTRHALWLATAAVGLLAVLGAGVWRVLRSPAAHAPSASVVATSAAPAAGTALVDLAFEDTWRQLHTALDERREMLSPATLRTIDNNLGIIEAAIDEIQAALATDPGNARLQQMLVATRQREVALLRQVTLTAALR